MSWRKVKLKSEHPLASCGPAPKLWLNQKDSDPYIIHLNIATCKWWFPFILVVSPCFGGKKRMFPRFRRAKSPHGLKARLQGAVHKACESMSLGSRSDGAAQEEFGGAPGLLTWFPPTPIVHTTSFGVSPLKRALGLVVPPQLSTPGSNNKPRLATPPSPTQLPNFPTPTVNPSTPPTKPPTYLPIPNNPRSSSREVRIRVPVFFCNLF